MHANVRWRRGPHQSATVHQRLGSQDMVLEPVDDDPAPVESGFDRFGAHVVGRTYILGGRRR